MKMRILNEFPIICFKVLVVNFKVIFIFLETVFEQYPDRNPD